MIHLNDSCMKKAILRLGMALVTALAVLSCTAEFKPFAEAEESSCVIYAGLAGTKTANAGMKTVWVDGDALNVFHAPSGTAEYSGNSKFVVSDVSAGIFETGSLQGTPSDVNDWYAIYPYAERIKTPASKNSGYTMIGSHKGLVQKGYGSMAHLGGTACPLYGVAEGVSGSDVPSMEMNHLSSVLKVRVTNNSGSPAAITEVAFTSDEYLTGEFYIDVTGETPSYKAITSYASKTSSVTVSGGSKLAAGASADVYLVLKPFVAKVNSVLSLSVNGVAKKLTLTESRTFAAGKIKTVEYSLDPAVDYPVPDGKQVYFTIDGYPTILDIGLTVPGKLCLAQKDEFSDVYYYADSEVYGYEIVPESASSGEIRLSGTHPIAGKFGFDDGINILYTSYDGKSMEFVSELIFHDGEPAEILTKNVTVKPYALEEHSADGKQWVFTVDGSPMVLDLGYTEEGMLYLAYQTENASGKDIWMTQLVCRYNLMPGDNGNGKIYTEADMVIEYSELTEYTVRLTESELFVFDVFAKDKTGTITGYVAGSGGL